MVRFPKKVLLVKAQMLQQDYAVACLKRGLPPERFVVSTTYLIERSTSIGFRTGVRIENTKWQGGFCRSGWRYAGFLLRKCADVYNFIFVMTLSAPT